MPVAQSDLDAMTLEYAAELPLFAAEQLFILDKGARKITLCLNSAQSYLHEILELQRSAWGRVRAWILKGRQQGVSTYIEARLYHRLVFSLDALRAFILTHEQAATDQLYEMANRYHDNVSPEFQHISVASNAKELRLDFDGGIQVGTAGTKGVGRSKTLHLFHGSECAFWPHALSHAAGVLQAVPDEEGTEILLESTANGMGGYFHTGFKEALDILRDKYAGDIRAMAVSHRGYLPIFIPWFWQSEYKTDGLELPLTEQELELVDLYGLTNEQLAWRRKKIEELRTEDLFAQEYPCNPDEAFRLSGRSFFPAEAVMRVRGTVRPPLMRGVLELADSGGIRFVPQRDGWLRVWEEPEPGESYVGAMDVSEGLDEPADRTVLDVFTRGIQERQVAQAIIFDEPDVAGELAVRVAKWYGGKVWLGIERNSLGIGACKAAFKTGYSWLFRMPKGDEVTSKTEKESDKIGWKTTVTSRPVLCTDLLAALRDGGMVIRSEETAAEVGSFVVINGKPQAAEGCRDDTVIAAGIARQMAQRTVPPADNEEPPKYVKPPRHSPHGWMAA